MADFGVGESKLPFNLRIAKVFADPLRMKILAELSTRVMSPKQFYEEFGGGSLPRVARHFDVLVEYDWLILVETKSGGSRRGAIEHFYRAPTPPVLGADTWPDLPDTMKHAFTSRVFETLAGQITAAMMAGTFDAREDRHFSWTALRLDLQGWRNLISRADGLFELLFEEQALAEQRLAESGEEPIPMTVAIAVFESPEDTTKAP